MLPECLFIVVYWLINTILLVSVDFTANKRVFLYVSYTYSEEVSLYVVMNVYNVLPWLQVAGLLCVISYWQSLVDQMEGKVKRVRYLAMLENIQRAAAQGATGGRSFYTTMYASQGSLANLTGKSSQRQ